MYAGKYWKKGDVCYAYHDPDKRFLPAFIVKEMSTKTKVQIVQYKNDKSYATKTTVEIGKKFVQKCHLHDPNYIWRTNTPRTRKTRKYNQLKTSFGRDSKTIEYFLRKTTTRNIRLNQQKQRNKEDNARQQAALQPLDANGKHNLKEPKKAWCNGPKLMPKTTNAPLEQLSSKNTPSDLIRSYSNPSPVGHITQNKDNWHDGGLPYPDISKQPNHQYAPRCQIPLFNSLERSTTGPFYNDVDSAITVDKNVAGSFSFYKSIFEHPANAAQSKRLANSYHGIEIPWRPFQTLPNESAPPSM